MWHTLRGLVLSSLAALTASGCATWEHPTPGRLNAVRPAIETVALDVVIARVPMGDPVANGELWNEIDEQPLPTELRRLLAANGLRAGVIGMRLPVPLERLLKMNDRPPSDDPVEHVVDFEKEPAVRHRMVRIVSGRRTNIICTGENSRHAELPVLMREPDGGLRGRTYRQVMGLLAAHAQLEGDGRVRLELVPEIEHGEPQRRFEPGEGMMKIEFGPPHEKYEFLRMPLVLSPGQMLLITGLPDRPGSLGYQFFMEPGAQKPQQKLVLVRLAQTQYDDLFTADGLLDWPGAEEPTPAAEPGAEGAGQR